MILPPICDGCRHNRKDGTCDAFPDGIPLAILRSEKDHRRHVYGDHGIVFAPKDAEANAYAEQVFAEGGNHTNRTKVMD